MLLDALLQLSNAQAVTTTAVSTNTIDLSQKRDLGWGENLHAVFGVDTTPTAAGAATVTFQIVSSAAAALSSPTVLAQSDAIPITDLTAGRAPIIVDLSPAVLKAQALGQRYLGVQYTIGTGPLTAGAFTAYLSNSEAAGTVAYPSGFTVA